jgi:glycosyltransferase involved in cell wall biosynthesis
MFILGSSFNRDLGGIQAFSYYLLEYLKFHDFSFTAVENDKSSVYARIMRFFSSVSFNEDMIATDWHRLANVLPFVILSKLNIRKKNIYVFIYGDEILNLGVFYKFVLNFMIKSRRVKLLCISRITKNFLREITTNNNIAIVHPFLDFRTYVEPSKRATVGRRSKSLTFTTISRLAKRKNIIGVLYALKKIKDKKIEFTYYLGGRGPDEAEIRDTVMKLGLEMNVKILGFVDSRRRDSLLAQTDLFILPSLQIENSIEGYGISFIEANYYGVPVISGNTGGMKDSVIDGVTGFRCNGKPDDIYWKMMKAISYKFDRKKIVEFAMGHDIRNNLTLYRILKGGRV